jgi:hypothetical protein
MAASPENAPLNSQLVGVFVIDAAGVTVCQGAGGLREQAIFDACAPFGGTTTTPPLTTATKAQTYTFADEDDVNIGLIADLAGGLRGRRLLSAMLAVG